MRDWASVTGMLHKGPRVCSMLRQFRRKPGTEKLRLNSPSAHDG